jgi:hypothetical protein
MLYRIRLHLARSQEFPNGSARHGYEILAPLDAAGHLDEHEWRRERERCTARRFWAGESDQIGQLRHSSGGRDGATWMIDYDIDASDDDERGYRLDRHVFAPGEYITLSDQQKAHTFRVAAVEPASEE